MDAPGKEFIVAYPDQIAFAIKILVGAVVLMGGSMIVGAKWIAAYILKHFETQFEKIGQKVDRIADSLGELAGKTSKDIAEINIRCEERHINHRRVTDLGER